MAKKQDEHGLQPDGSLSFTVILPAPLAKQFLDAMAADERESKSEFGRLLIKRQLLTAAERRAFDEFRRQRQAESEAPFLPGNPSPETQERQSA